MHKFNTFPPRFNLLYTTFLYDLGYAELSHKHFITVKSSIIYTLQQHIIQEDHMIQILLLPFSAYQNQICTVQPS